jgi:hypothetical protein
VGLEQVVLDQTMYDGRFLEEFNEAEFKLKAVSAKERERERERGGQRMQNMLLDSFLNLGCLLFMIARILYNCNMIQGGAAISDIFDLTASYNYYLK